MIKTFITHPTVFNFESDYPWTIVDKLCETISGLIVSEHSTMNT